jgi:hypothetical protein
MKWTRSLLVVGAVCLCAALPARAEQVVEAFRTPFGAMSGVAVNPTVGSVWVASGGSVMHLAADGSIIGQFDGFQGPGDMAVDPTDGSCWFTNPRSVDLANSEVIHLAADGTELLRLGDFYVPCSISVNPTDGSCWVLDMWSNEAVHIAADGTELLRLTGHYCFSGWPGMCSVDPNDGSCWVISVGGSAFVTHYAEDGAVLWEKEYAGGNYPASSVSVNPDDGSCWLALHESNSVLHLAADGSELWHGDFEDPWWVGVNEADGSCWVAGGGGGGYAAHLAADGTQLVRVEGVSQSPWEGPVGAVDPADGSVWVADTGYGGELVHLAQDGTELWRGAGLRIGYNLGGGAELGVNTADGSLWTATYYWEPGDICRSTVAHRAADGTELSRGPGLYAVNGFSVDSGDGSCWLTGMTSDAGGEVIIHLAEDGTELWGGSFPGSSNPSANSTDGSCWFAAGQQLIHLADDGSELLRVDIGAPGVGVAVNPADNTVWVGGNSLVHLSENGTELLRVAPTSGSVGQVSAVSADGSCWYGWSYASGYATVHVAANGTELTRIMAGGFFSTNSADGSLWRSGGTDVVHVGAHGEELWRGPAVGAGQTRYMDAIAVNSSDGSCWVRLEGGQLARLEVPGWRVPRFYDVPSYFWAFEAVEACFDANIVKGYTDGLYHPEYTVDRGTMAVYISRALAGGDSNIPDGPATPSFSDVPTDHWAYKHIEYAVSQNVVKGYTDGTYLPGVTVDRGTMAVYVARAMVAPGGDAAIPDPPVTATFPDVPTDFWSYKQVEYCVSQGVVQGYDDGTYRPYTPVTRDQMAVYVARAFGLL